MRFGSSFSLWEKVRMRVILRNNLSLALSYKERELLLFND
jgi:hypothetical protein